MLRNDNNVQAILDNLIDTFYRTDAEGRCVLVTPSIQELLGYSVEEMSGKKIASLYVYPELRADLLEQMKHNGGQIRNFEAQLKHKQGHPVWVSVNIQFYYDEQGKYAGVEGLVRDISDSKKVEARLTASEHNYRSIINNMTDTYYRTDLDGVLTMVSPSLPRLLGYDADAVIGTRLEDFYYQEGERDRFLAALNERGGRYIGYEVQLKHYDGR
ncbi:MAG: PAS domain S-box protein, partial [Gammaproteobacteria bacterium]|nr:PAS domain S-box protein [Gammaproteobacteria bacterium]